MATTITAGNATNGAAISSDNTGILELKTGTGSGTTALTLSTGQNATFAGTITVANGITDDLKFNSGYGSVATAYGCRAWVNFDGTSNTANLSGTYSQSGTTVTVTATAHGLIAGNSILADITTGTGVDGIYTVATVISSSQFTYTAGTSLTTSGNITLVRNTIRASGGVSSIADVATGDFIVNFTTAMPDANYAIVANADNDVGASLSIVSPYFGQQTTSRSRIRVWSTGFVLQNSILCTVAVFR